MNSTAQNIKKPDSIHRDVIIGGDTRDIINTVFLANRISPNYVEKFSPGMQGDTVEQTCRNIFNFIKKNIPYNEDPEIIDLNDGTKITGVVTTDKEGDYIKVRVKKGDVRTIAYKDIKDRTGYQMVQSPGELYKNRDKSIGGTGKGGDCKSYSNFTHGVLVNLGIPHFERFIKETEYDQDGNPLDLHHVYVCVPTADSNYIVVDAVMDEFDKEVPWAKAEDYDCDMNRYNNDGTPKAGAAVAGISNTTAPVAGNNFLNTATGWVKQNPLPSILILLGFVVIVSE